MDPMLVKGFHTHTACKFADLEAGSRCLSAILHQWYEALRHVGWLLVSLVSPAQCVSAQVHLTGSGWLQIQVKLTGTR